MEFVGFLHRMLKPLAEPRTNPLPEDLIMADFEPAFFWE